MNAVYKTFTDCAGSQSLTAVVCSCALQMSQPETGGLHGIDQLCVAAYADCSHKPKRFVSVMTLDKRLAKALSVACHRM